MKVIAAVADRTATPSKYVVLTYLLYALAIVFFMFPVFWVLSMSLRPPGEILTYPVQFVPREITISAYYDILYRTQIPTWLGNSFKIALFEVIGIVLVVVPAAYGFSRFDFRNKRGVLVGILLFQMISPVIIVIPLYDLMITLGLMNTHLGLILLYIGLQVPFSVWLMKSYFDTVPTALDDSARIDGCNRLEALWYILLPAVKPGIAVVAIFNFVFSWAEFVLAFTILESSDLYTIAMGIFVFQGQYTADWRLIAAGSVVAIVPILIIFIGLQKYFVRGLTEGAVKG